MVVGPLLSLVKEKASSYLLDQYKVMEGMEEQHEKLKVMLPAILEKITDAEKQATSREAIRPWLEKLKVAAYEAIQVFDEFNYEALRRQAKKEGRYIELGMGNRIMFRYKMGNKLRKIVRDTEALVEHMRNFGFDKQPQAQVQINYLRENDSTMVDPEIVSRSRDEEKQKIVRMLVKEQANNKDPMVVPIVGMGGLGKTTLAQLIYNDPQVKKHFHQLMKWVCVSDDDFDVCNLANKICNASESNLESALQNLQRKLAGKRYLLVLDDVWNKDDNKWNKLNVCLKHGDVGSAILTTTRDKKIAQLMGTVKGHDIAHLDNKFIKEIIEAKAFISQERKPTDLAGLVDDVVERCAGSPLAAKALGSVLRGKITEEWKAVLSKSIAHNKDDQILPILKLSYDDLPSHMKQCFAFCAVFPKDHEINVEMLIQLWMANDFIPEQKDVRHETIGKQIFSELVSRSFFQDVKQVNGKAWEDVYWYLSTSTCKIHDLMHDVALSVMGKEVATITEKPKQSDEFLQNTCRHILLSCGKPEAVLNDSLNIRSPAMQTLLCGQRIESSLQHLAKYSSLRALQLCQNNSTILLKPKQLHLLRYLDISWSHIVALPEDISILYNLQTLNVAHCHKLGRLPKGIKYMTALRHLYTHECWELKRMPPEVGHLTSLQTLTNFVVGAGPDCSSIAELQHLNNLGGPLLLSQLENVTNAADAKQANLGNKKELRELSLNWTWTGSQEEKLHCHKVLEGLEAPPGLEALRIEHYQGTSFPTWMGTLTKMVELHLSNCNKSHKLPPLGSVPALQVLRLERLKKLESLCSGGTFFHFPNLKKLTLDKLPEFDWVQGEQIMFPQLERLFISNCGKVTALPGPALLGGSCCGDYKEQDERKLWSAFPVLKVLELECLAKFQRWGGAAEATQGQQIIFPYLEELSIEKCPELAALPSATSQGESFDHSDVTAWSAFPNLKKLLLEDLDSFKSLGMMEEQRFPDLETLSVKKCPKLTTLPGVIEAPKLGVLQIHGSQLAAIIVPTFINSLSELVLSVEFTETTLPTGHSAFELLDASNKYPLTSLKLSGCNFLFPSSPLALWTCFVQLQRLKIKKINHALVYWPEKEFHSLVSLRHLSIKKCRGLIGYAKAAPGQPISERSQVLPRLESLHIEDCESLVEVFNVPASLKTMDLRGCPKLKSIFGEQQDEPTLNQGPSAARDHLLLPCLEYLYIERCESLSEVLNLPPSLREIVIWECGKLQLLSGQLDGLQRLLISVCPELRSLESCLGEFSTLERLSLCECKSLASLPDGPQAYSSLHDLQITSCPAIQPLPSSLKKRLDNLGHVRFSSRGVWIRGPYKPAEKLKRLICCERKTLFGS
ncbi:disease resistance protein RGA2 isoform X2 [Setaria italica]|nr:disease resistance protein RGA2 isoform X2 [Setaria italica]